MADDTKETGMSASEMVEKIQEVFEDKVVEFDMLLSTAMNTECLNDFIEGYLQLRETGFDFDDAFKTAAEQIELEVQLDDDDEDDEDDNKTE